MKELIPVPSHLPTSFTTALLDRSSRVYWSLQEAQAGCAVLPPVFYALSTKYSKEQPSRAAFRGAAVQCLWSALAWLGPAELREGPEHLYPATPQSAPPCQRTAPLPSCCSKDVHRLVLAVLDTKRRMHEHVFPSVKAPLMPRLGF